jgi:signal transduction histidine kinase/ligand-binding sensor domain-containing protein/CheY-like chemotaxis protein
VAALCPAPAGAGDEVRPLAQYGREVWQTEQGLPQNSIQAILQTRDGYLWLGTQEGLARFDGVRFVVFDKTNTAAIRHNSIQALLETRDGSLWIATYVGGLARLKDGQFTAYSTAEGLPDDQVLSLLEDRAGTLWAGTRGGLARLDDGGRFSTFRMREGLLDNRVWALHEDRQGALWIGTDGGLNRLHEGHFSALTAREGLPPAAVHAMREDAEGVLWVGTYGGLARVEQGRVTRVYTSADGLANNLIWTLATDRQGSLWIGTSNGVSRLAGGRLESLTPADGLANGLVRALAEDREGSFWIGTNGGGLTRLKSTRFVRYGAREGLPSEITRCMVEDGRGAVWIGTDAGLGRLEGGRLTAVGAKQGFTDARVFSLHVDRKGTLWIGTHGEGLWSYAGGRFRSLRLKDGLPSEIVRSIAEDREGALWIGTESGLAVLRDGRFTAYGRGAGLPSAQVFTILEARDGTLWLGTGRGLVARRGGRFESLGTAEGLRSTVVFALYEDEDEPGTIWIGTDGGGLHRWREGRLRAFTARDGLVDDLVVQILDDRRGRLWMTSNRGASSVPKRELAEFFDGRRMRVEAAAWGTADGMPSGECHGGSQPAGWRTRDGRLWFPTLKGAAVVDPARLGTNRVPPPVVIEEVLVDRQLFDLRGQGRVPPGRRDFEFHYTALSLLAPGKVRFQYRLEGFDEGWVDAGARRAAYYTRLPPGDYRFRVKAANDDGLWNEKGAALAFAVLPRFFETRWFVALAVLGGMGLAAGGLRLRLRHMRRRQQELEALVEARTRDVREAQVRAEAARERAEDASRAKTRFLANVSHELRTPLSAILGFVEVMQRRPGRDDPDQEHLAVVHRSGEHLLGLINDVLSISQIEAGRVPLRSAPFRLPGLLQGVGEIFRDRAATKGLELEIVPVPGLPEWVQGDEGKLRQVLINLLANAVKFTAHGRVTLRAAWLAGQAVFEVEDTGPGISSEELERLFAPFAQGEAGHVQEGTGLGLAISRSHAELMKGELTVRSAPGEGACFRLTLPLPAAVSAPGAAAPAQGTSRVLRIDRAARVLVVDDSPENRLLMARLHALVGLDVQEAKDGLEAVALWESFRPDLIWMDTRMPRMDGPTATREIRRQEAASARPHVPIIAVTAEVLETAEGDLLAAGYDEVMAKPYRSESIFRTLERLVPARPGGGGQEP